MNTKNISRGGQNDGRRGGAVIVIVLALTSAMAFLGFFFYGFTKYEGNASDQFAAVDTAEVDADAVVDFAMEQFIVGTRPDRTNSALYGSNYSLLAGVVGPILSDGTPLDTAAFNGAGIGVLRRSFVPASGLEFTRLDADGRAPGEPGYAGGAGVDELQYDRASVGSGDGVPDAEQVVGFDRNRDGFADFYQANSGVFYRIPMNQSGSARVQDLDDAGGGTHPRGFPSPFGTVNDPLVDMNGFDPLFAGLFGTDLYSVPASPTLADAWRRAMLYGAGNGGMFFEPDAGYTAADVNSMYLAHRSRVQTPNAGERPVVVASFDRPGYFPDFRTRTSVGGDVNSGFADFFGQTLSNDGTYLVAEQTLFPHRDHIIAKTSPLHPDVPRFIYSDPTPTAAFGHANTLSIDGQDEIAATGGLIAKSGDRSRVIEPFPFYVDVDGDGMPNERGLYSYGNEPGDPGTSPGDGRFDPATDNGVGLGQTVPAIEYAVDNDGDGIRDSQWMDLGHGLVELSAGRQVVPMFAPLILDADALLNVNAHGNPAGLGPDPVAKQPSAVHPVGDEDGDGVPEQLSRSNTGFTRSEINLGRALIANPLDPAFFDGDAASRARLQREYHAMFGTPPPDEATPPGGPVVPGAWPTAGNALPPVTRQAMANMDLAMLLFGRIRAEDGRPLPGRYGEPLSVFETDDPRGNVGPPLSSVPFEYEPFAGANGSSIPLRYFGRLPQPGRTRFDGQFGSNPFAPYENYRLSNPVRAFDDDLDSNDPDGDFRDGNVALAAKTPPVFARGGRAYYDPQLRNLTVPPVVHPLSTAGTGTTVDDLGRRILVATRKDEADNTAAAAATTPDNPAWMGAAGEPDAVLADGGIAPGTGAGDGDLRNESPAVYPGYRGVWQEQFTSGDGSRSGVAEPEENFETYTRTLRNVGGKVEAGGTVVDAELDPDGPNPTTPTTRNRTVSQTNPLPADAVSILQPQAADWLANSTEELELDPARRVSGDTGFGAVDAPFAAAENGPLQLSRQDVLRAGLASRIQELMPFNLRESRSADETRRLLTTDSWDRLEFTAPPEMGSTTAFSATRDWEYNDWQLPGPPPGWDVTSDPRYSPFAPESPINGQYSLAPHLSLDGVGTFPNGRPNPGVPVGNELFPGEQLFPPMFVNGPVCFGSTAQDTDPFRYELRRLLATPSKELSAAGISGSPLSAFTLTNLGAPSQTGGRLSPRQRLNITRLLDGFDRHGNPVYRHLTPHVVIDRADPNERFEAEEEMYHGLPIAAATDADGDGTAGDRVPAAFPAWYEISDGVLENARPAAELRAQDWWARYDRQRMARDIYVLLYTTALPDYFDPTTQSPDTFTPTFAGGAANAPSAADAQLTVQRLVREYAQFAVNVVDAVDRDDVITRFEYDADLSDGWDLRPASDTASTLAVANGVEAQKLTISEAMWVKTDEAPTGTPAGTTGFANDQTRQFLYVELRNVSPFEVMLYDGNYRLVRVDAAGNREACVRFRHATPNGYTDDAATTTEVLRIGPGANFVVATKDGAESGDNQTSDFVATVNQDDINGGGGGTVISPQTYKIVPNANATPGLSADAPAANLDLVYAGPDPPRNAAAPATEVDATRTHPEYFNTDVAVAGGSGLLVSAGTNDTVAEFTLVLERRRQLDAFDRLENGNTADAVEAADVAELSGGNFEVNDWVEVDRILLRERRLPDSAFQSQVVGVNQLRSTLVSTRRAEPFGPTDDTTGAPAAGGGGTPLRVWNHTFEEAGDVPGQDPDEEFHFPNDGPRRDEAGTVTEFTPFTTWQPHFDRDITSVAELLSIPLTGFANRESRQLSATAGTSPVTPEDVRLFGGPCAAVVGTTDVSNSYREDGALLISNTSGFAAGRVLRTEDDTPAGDTVDHNRMYRLLEFATARIPHLDDDRAPRTREPGKVNLSTLRDEEVYAAVIDDGVHLSDFDEVDDTATAVNERYVAGQPTLDLRDRVTPDLLARPLTGNENQFRNWFAQLLRNRDGVPMTVTDPAQDLPYFRTEDTQTRLPLPGMPGSTPFRGMADLSPKRAAGDWTLMDESLADTVLAADADFTGPETGGLPPGTKPDDHFGLFDARLTQQTEDWTGASTATIDLHTRNRILRKVMNHGTVRSNVFFVWVTVGLFEAHRPFDGHPELDYMVQIGGEADPGERYRYFFVVDRSKLEEAYVDQNPGDGLPGKFDFRRFILYSERLQ